jgi:hypothetical protein
MAKKHVTWWQRFGNISQVVQASVAIIGIGAILFQVNEIRTNSRAASARQIYLAYLDLAFKNPELAAPDYDRIKAADQNTRGRYETFVSYFLYACEEALAVFEREREWKDSCEYDVKYHLPFLCDKNKTDPAFLKTYSDKTQSFVQSAMTRAGVASPECKLRKP